jgi:hypothetical protein
LPSLSVIDVLLLSYEGFLEHPIRRSAVQVKVHTVVDRSGIGLFMKEDNQFYEVAIWTSKIPILHLLKNADVLRQQ